MMKRSEQSVGGASRILIIHIIGSRGIPCKYGGFETFAERLAMEMVGRGHKVTVYGLAAGASSVEECSWNGVTCVNVRGPNCKAIEKPAIALKAVIHSLRRNPEIILFLGVSAAYAAIIGRIWGTKTIVNLDGLEWKRGKWGPLGKGYLYCSEMIAARGANAVVADSRALGVLYRRLHHVESSFIPYGADVSNHVPQEALAAYGLEPGKYLIQCCRIEPENNVDLVVDGYELSRCSFPLLIVGDAPRGSKYMKRLQSNKPDRVHFLGGIYGPSYRQLVAHAAAYIHGHEVGGTNPSLLEAMAVGQAPLYLDVQFNSEVVSDIGYPFKKTPESLSEQLCLVFGSGGIPSARKERARQRIRENYNWENVYDSYERLFESVSTS